MNKKWHGAKVEKVGDRWIWTVNDWCECEACKVLRDRPFVIPTQMPCVLVPVKKDSSGEAKA